MSTLVRLLIILAALLLSASAAPALTYHETTDGDLPGPSFLGENPPILELDFGTNQVSGSQQIIVDFPSGIDEDDPDAFQIQLPAKGFLSNISVTFENEIIGHPAAETFMDYRLLLAPPSFDEPRWRWGLGNDPALPGRAPFDPRCASRDLSGRLHREHHGGRDLRLLLLDEPRRPASRALAARPARPGPRRSRTGRPQARP